MANLLTLPTMHSIATLYHFTALDDPHALREELMVLCDHHQVQGTILIATEGINGTIASEGEGVNVVVAHIASMPAFGGLVVKWSETESQPFHRLKVRLKKEIVTLGVGPVNTRRNTGTHVPAGEWRELIEQPDVVLIDARNDYEVAVGTFRGAVDPQTASFTELPTWIEENPDIAKDTKLAMFCTGGIRCEKATAYLRERGFRNVFQLEGGILKYLEDVPKEESVWEGECYVFDRRVSVGHGLVPGDLEVCPNCNTVIGEEDRVLPGYAVGVACPSCHDTISADRLARFAERQHQIELAKERGTVHLGRPA